MYYLYRRMVLIYFLLFLRHYLLVVNQDLRDLTHYIVGIVKIGRGCS